MRLETVTTTNGTLCNVDTVEDREYLLSLGVDVDALEVTEQAKIDAVIAKETTKMSADYNGTIVSLTSDDALGLLQVQSAFELGVTATVFHFSNGTTMALDTMNFSAFATWFVAERNKFFI